jgi:hypothetical protein
MLIRTWRFATLVLVALSVGASYCHALELPAKMQWAGPLYVQVQNEPPGLYIMFGLVGAAVEILAILAAGALAYLVRGRRPAFSLTLVGAGLLVMALIAWVLLIAPANAVMSGWTPQTVPPDWIQWRDRWEYTHAANFVLKLVGFCALVASVVVETPDAAAVEAERERRRDAVPV